MAHHVAKLPIIITHHQLEKSEWLIRGRTYTRHIIHVFTCLLGGSYLLSWAHVIDDKYSALNHDDSALGILSARAMRNDDNGGNSIKLSCAG